MPCGDSLSRFHFQNIIEAVEVVEEADGRGQLDDLALVVMLAQLAPEGVIHIMRPKGFAFGQFQRSFFGGGKIIALSKVCQPCDLPLRPSVPFCQNGVGGQSILAGVDLRSTDNNELL